MSEATNEQDYIDLTKDVRFSWDFRVCLHHGREYVFEDLESRVMEAIVLNYQETKFTTMLNEDLEEAAFPINLRGMKSPRDIFRKNRRRNGKKLRMNPAWGVVIGPGDAKGSTRLILNPPNESVT